MTETPSNEYTAPWIRAELLPTVPPHPTYGYVRNGQGTPCSREELVEVAGRYPITFAWTPETARLVPAWEIDFLLEPLRVRRHQELLASLKRAGMWFGGGAIYLAMELTGKSSFGRGYGFVAVVLMIVYGVIPGIQDLWKLARSSRFSDRHAMAEGKFIRYSYWLSGQNTKCMWWVGTPIIIMGVLQLLVGLNASIDAAGLEKELARQSEPWRMVSCTFLHGGLMHFYFNFNALMILGGLMGKLCGRNLFILTFMLATLVGSLFSMTFGAQDIPSIGASGGLMGLFGFLSVYGFRHRRAFPGQLLKALMMSVFWIGAIGFILSGMIDNAAHLGGFVGGVTVAAPFMFGPGSTIPMKENGLIKGLGNAATAALFGFAALTAFKLITHG